MTKNLLGFFSFFFSLKVQIKFEIHGHNFFEKMFTKVSNNDNNLITKGS